MAQEIAPTPVLSGKAADEFVEKMFEPLTEKEIAFIEDIMETFKDYDPFSGNK